MKVLFKIVFIFFVNFGFSQIGVNTTAPTEALDVDGNLRVRNLSEGTVVSDADGVVHISPIRVVATGKVVAGTTPTFTGTGATVTRNAKGEYTITLDEAMSSADYTIILTVKSCNGRCPGTGANYDAPSATYYNQTASSFDVMLGDSDNGSSKAVAIDIEFMFVVYSF